MSSTEDTLETSHRGRQSSSRYSAPADPLADTVRRFDDLDESPERYSPQEGTSPRLSETQGDKDCGTNTWSTPVLATVPSASPTQRPVPGINAPPTNGGLPLYGGQDGVDSSPVTPAVVPSGTRRSTTLGALRQAGSMRGNRDAALRSGGASEMPSSEGAPLSGSHPSYRPEPRQSLNDVCPNVVLASLMEAEALSTAESQRRRVFFLTAAACCTANAHVLMAVDDATDALSPLMRVSHRRVDSGSSDVTPGSTQAPTGVFGNVTVPPALTPTARGGHARHQRTASALPPPSGGANANAAAVTAAALEESAALDRLLHLLAPSFPPNHRLATLLMTDATTRDDIAAVLEEAQNHSPQATLLDMARKRASRARRPDVVSPVDGGGAGAPVGHRGVPIASQHQSTARARAHRRTFSAQSSDSSRMTPEPTNDDGAAADPAALVPQRSVSVQPRVSRRTASNEGLVQGQTVTASPSGGPSSAATCTTTIGTIVVAVGVERLAPAVADAFGTFLLTGSLPPAPSALAHASQAATFQGVTVVSVVTDSSVPRVSTRVRAGFVLSVGVSLNKWASRKGSTGPSRHGSSIGRGGPVTSHGASARSTPTSLVGRGGADPGPAGHQLAGLGLAPTHSPERQQLVKQLNHDVFVVMAVAKVTSTKPEVGAFGKSIHNAFIAGENGATVPVGPTALIAARGPAPGQAFFAAQGRLFCPTAVERYMRQHIQLLRGVIAPQCMAMEPVPLNHAVALGVLQAAVLLLSRLSIDPEAMETKRQAAAAATRSTAPGPSVGPGMSMYTGRARVTGPAVEAAFELVQRAAVGPRAPENAKHVDPRYVPRERLHGTAGRHAERVFVTPDDALCLLPHLLAHHLCLPAPLLDSAESVALTIRVGGAHAGLGGGGTSSMSRHGAASGFLNAISALAATTSMTFGHGSQNATVDPLSPGTATLSHFEWDACFVEHAARAARSQQPTSPLAQQQQQPKNGTTRSTNNHTRFPSEPMSAQQGGGGGVGGNQLGMSTALTMSTQLRQEDTNAEFAPLARKVSFNNRAGESKEFAVALAAYTRTAMPYDATLRRGSSMAPSGGGHTRTHSQFSAQSFDADERSTGSRVDSGAFENPSLRGSLEHPWPAQQEMSQLAPYSRCFTVVASRLLDNQSILRPPA